MLKKVSFHQISAALAIFAFTLFIIFKSYHSEEIKLTDAIVLGLTAGMLPTAFLLIKFPFKPEITLDELNRFSPQIAIGGLVLLYIYGKTIIETFYH